MPVLLGSSIPAVDPYIPVLGRMLFSQRDHGRSVHYRASATLKFPRSTIVTRGQEPSGPAMTETYLVRCLGC